MNHATSSNLYRSYYPHWSRELVSPVCGIFLKGGTWYTYIWYLRCVDDLHEVYMIYMIHKAFPQIETKLQISVSGKSPKIRLARTSQHLGNCETYWGQHFCDCRNFIWFFFYNFFTFGHFSFYFSSISSKLTKVSSIYKNCLRCGKTAHSRP